VIVGLLKKYLSPTHIDFLREQKLKVFAKSYRFWAVSEKLGSLFYFIFSSKFDREHTAVLLGRAEYCDRLSRLGQSSATLRRNIHRLEKGLVMVPRRLVFGESFISETIKIFGAAVKTDGYSQSELLWARDVIELYFESVSLSESEVLRSAKQHYGAIDCSKLQNFRQTSALLQPYPAGRRSGHDIPYEGIYQLFKQRRSVRWYDGRRVCEDDVHKLIDLAALAPSACNRQSYRFDVALRPEDAAKIAECAGGTAGFSHQIPAIIVVIGDLSSYVHERDRHLIYIDSSLAAMQIMAGAETLGLSTCPINWPDVPQAEDKIRSVVSLQSHERIVMLIALGYADPEGGIPYSGKKGIESLLKIR
jgi:nitroreductase